MRPIRFIAPFVPGGGGDIVGRLPGQRLPERLGKPLIVDNRGGAGGTLGTDLAAKAVPDGYIYLVARERGTAGVEPVALPGTTLRILRVT